MKLAFVFPGQGSQRVGMGKEIHDDFPEAREVFQEASDALGYDVASLCFSGPGEELNKTFRTQPAILTVSGAILAVLSPRKIKPAVVAGHSLGEYSALVASGVLSFSDAVRLTEQRGKYMQEAVPEGRGLMAAILGLERSAVEEICRSLKSGYAAPANYNCPGQIVISGERVAVEEAIGRAEESGAGRAMTLPVSVPSHCNLMGEASQRLGKVLDTIEFRNPVVPLVNNADAMVLDSVESIKASLVRQLNGALLWEDSMRVISSAGVDAFVEVGPGKVLSALIKRIVPGARILNVEDRRSLEKTLTELTPSV